MIYQLFGKPRRLLIYAHLSGTMKFQVVQAPDTASSDGASSKISGYFGRAPPPMNWQRQEHLRQKLVDMIIEDLRPTDIATGRSFWAVRDFLHPCYPRTSFGSTMSHIRLKYVRQRKILQSELQAIMKNSQTLPCLTADTWISNQNESFLAVTCHVLKGGMSEWVVS